MSFWSFLTGSTGNLIESVGNVAGKFITTEKDQLAFKLKLEELLQQRDAFIEQSLQTELQAKERVLIAELNQGDKFTKRARPTVVYFGLFMIFLNYCFIPIVSNLTGNALITPLDLPGHFWAAWGGIVSTWCIGRTFEKRGSKSDIVGKITGTKSLWE